MTYKGAGIGTRTAARIETRRTDPQMSQMFADESEGGDRPFFPSASSASSADEGRGTVQARDCSQGDSSLFGGAGSDRWCHDPYRPLS